jgi:hypothetical protein
LSGREFFWQVAIAVQLTSFPSSRLIDHSGKLVARPLRRQNVVSALFQVELVRKCPKAWLFRAHVIN